MVKTLNEFKLNKFNTGMNLVDSSVNMINSDLVAAENVEFLVTGGVKSMNPPLQVANDIIVNNQPSITILGGCIFNDTEYLMCSNGVQARWMYKTSDSKSITSIADVGDGVHVRCTSNAHGLKNGNKITIALSTVYDKDYYVSNVTTNTFDIVSAFLGNYSGTWITVLFKEANSQNFDPNTPIQCEVYKDKIWFINGKTTVISGKSCVLCFIDIADVVTGLSTAECGLPVGLTSIKLHLQRIWLGGLNTLFASITKPNGDALDWDTTTAYTGADTAGYFIIDNNTEDYIQVLKMKFGMLVVYRRYSIWVLQGTTVLQMYITRQTNTKVGVRSPRSVAQGSNIDYFYSDEGVKIFTGQTVKEGTTNVDTISTDTLDRKIKPLIDAFYDRDELVGCAFRDKYYLSDTRTQILVFDAITMGWTTYTDSPAEIFLDKSGLLYFGIANKWYQINADEAGSITSYIRTKNFNCDNDVFWKVFDKFIGMFLTFDRAMSFKLAWHINGVASDSGSITVNIPSNAVAWDTGIKWDNTQFKWDSATIDFMQTKINKLKSGYTIAFSIEATGTNRFCLDNFSVIYEIIKREV